MIAVIIDKMGLFKTSFVRDPAYPPSDNIYFDGIAWCEFARDVSFSWLISSSGVAYGVDLYISTNAIAIEYLTDHGLDGDGFSIKLWFADHEFATTNGDVAEIGDRYYHTNGKLLLAFPTFGLDANSFAI